MDLYKPQDEKPLYAFTWSESEQPSSALVIALSEVNGTDPMDLEPLYNVLDPDALNSLFDSTGSSRLAGSVSFEYCGYQVTIEADGGGCISELADSDTASLSMQSVAGQLEGNL
ncbi:HalOD1 output domain-containing protein [Haloterrigena salinisoli]|uniref:HalOD1 output domain-containing protein n=1 Tax=Haloterrigena salinisoli TaxID=3132747 RepID=UPI0030CEB3CE